MKLFLKEQDFCDYLEKNFSNKSFTLGNSVVSINFTGLTPIMSCIYVSDSYIAAAKYNRHVGVFSDAFIIEKKDIKKLALEKKGMNYRLVINTKEKLPDGTYMLLKLNLSSMTAVKWHKKNLINISERY